MMPAVLQFNTPYITSSAGQTREIGIMLSAVLRAGDVVLLKGDMGVGKSEFARGVARGMGVTGVVPSPTFTIMNAYASDRFPLYHFDFYRIADEREVYDIGLDEHIDGDGAALIEWYERAESCLPENALLVTIDALDESRREITFHRIGGFHAIDGGDAE